MADENKEPLDPMSPAALAALEDDAPTTTSEPVEAATPAEVTEPVEGELVDPFGDEGEAEGEEVAETTEPVTELPEVGEPDTSLPVSKQFKQQREKYAARETALQDQIKALEEKIASTPEAPVVDEASVAEIEELRQFRARFDAAADPKFRDAYEKPIEMINEQARAHAKAAGLGENVADQLMAAPLEDRYKLLAELQKHAGTNPSIPAFMQQLSPLFARSDELTAGRQLKLDEVSQNSAEYLARQQGSDQETLLRDAMQEQYENQEAYDNVVIKLASQPIKVGDSELPAPKIFQSKTGRAAIKRAHDRLMGEELSREDVVQALVVAELFPEVYGTAVELKTQSYRRGNNGVPFGGGGGASPNVRPEVEAEIDGLRAKMGLK